MRSYIPPNLGENGGVLWGLTKKRNALEAGVYLVVIFLLVKIIPFSIAVKIILFIIFGLSGGILFVVGLNDQSVGEFLYHRYLFKKNKAIYTLGIPMPKEKQKTKKGAFRR